jgi:LysR family hydrogen peroxide-inducible transcriptional activator
MTPGARQGVPAVNFNQIRYFLAVADTLNFTNAAESCAISQPALSKAIRALEVTLGADLFDRSTQRVMLTHFGRTMQVHFERIEDNRRKALDAAKAATKAPIEQLNVGVMCTIGPRRFSQFLKNLCDTHPHMEVTLHDVPAAVIPELLLSGSLDCVFCARSAKHDQRFQVIDLFEESMVVAFANDHRFNNFESVPLAEIAKEPYLDRLNCGFRDDFLNFTKGSGLELNVALRSEREDWILEFLHKGLGVCIMPASSVILNTIAHRPISDFTNMRKLELVMTVNATVSTPLTAFRDAAAAFDWA